MTPLQGSGAAGRSVSLQPSRRLIVNQFQQVAEHDAAALVLLRQVLVPSGLGVVVARCAVWRAGRPPEQRRQLSHPDRRGRRFSPDGASRDRTDDLRLAKAALSQLSYGPSTVSLEVEVARRLALKPESVVLGRLFEEVRCGFKLVKRLRRGSLLDRLGRRLRFDFCLDDRF